MVFAYIGGVYFSGKTNWRTKWRFRWRRSSGSTIQLGEGMHLPKDTTWRPPDESVGDGRMFSGIAGDTDSGLCFFFRNSSLRLAFLLMVDGLFFLRVALALVSKPGASSLVSTEKEKWEPASQHVWICLYSYRYLLRPFHATHFHSAPTKRWVWELAHHTLWAFTC